ncbi:methionyl-tRNA synthetase [Microlunatus sagamiharensis]|uniref:Methionine--tRNA ligase n=1 Tax=Microlunatus sagamiharensis TaxID=546874 RepID=A0A1H2LI72_9ACTN|nr:methionyl-tRNA synthetase [Microlunatus sagamiharensis]
MARILTAVAWPYANGPRHIGHVSGFGVPSDVFSRFMRMSGHDVLMVSGTDEHGTPIGVQAEREGLTNREAADKYNRVIVEDLQGLGLSYDLFTRTTTLNHYAVVQDLFSALHRNGYVVPRVQMGAISPSTGRTLPDRYIEGTCPICGYTSARGDQCDNCGNQLDPIDLVEPRSRINGETPEFVETEHFFLDLPSLAGALGAWLETRTDWRPNVLKFSENLIAELKPRAITRDIDWGVPIPLEGWSEQPMKRLYVWFDAVIGYLSAAIEWAKRSGDPEAWRQWWTDPDARSYYFMGKDNIVFHSVIWPGILLGHNGQGDHGGVPGPFGELDLPSEVVSSEYLTMSGAKFSTSRNQVIYVGDFLREFGPDALRYFIAVAGPETTDSDFTWDEFVRRTNFELANEWGNLVNRSISLAWKNNGAIPTPNELQPVDTALLATAAGAYDVVGELLGRNRFKAAISEAMRLVQSANRYLSETEPWKLKDDPARRDTVLHTALQVVWDANTLLTPFLPHAAQKVFEALGGEGVWAAQPEIRMVSEDGGPDYPVLMGDYADEQARWESRAIVPGTPLVKPTPLFTKLDDELGRTGPSWAPIQA